MAKKIATHMLIDTSNPDIQKLVDWNGDWTHYYLKKQGRFVPAVNYVIRSGFPKGDRFMAYLANSSKDDIDRKLKSKGDEGTRTHEAIRMLINGSKVTLTTKMWNDIEKRNSVLTFDEWYNIYSFMNFAQKYKLRVVIHEYTLEIGIAAGTVDFFGEMTVPEDDKEFPKELRGQKVLALLDWKTSAGIWDEYKLQTAAYFEMVRAAGLFKKVGGKLDSTKFVTGVVRLGTKHKCGYELEVWDRSQTEDNYIQFNNAFQNYRFITGEKDGDRPTVTEYPSTYTLKVPRITKPLKEKSIKKVNIIKPKKAKQK